MPYQDSAVELCVLKGLIRGSRNNGLPLNAQEGHGRAYDEIAERRREDSTRYNVEDAKEANP